VIPVEDLIRRPHEPLRCLGYVLLGLERSATGYRRGEIPDTGEEAEVWLRKHGDTPWREIGKTVHCATMEGDVVYGIGERGPYAALLVDAAGGGFLTSTPEAGSHIRLRRGLRGVQSVQRRIQ